MKTLQELFNIRSSIFYQHNFPNFVCQENKRSGIFQCNNLGNLLRILLSGFLIEINTREIQLWNTSKN
jgi:hypothetical protein